jgi:FkbM family methyltransferase
MAAGQCLRHLARLGGPAGPVVAWRLAKHLPGSWVSDGRLHRIEARGLRWELDLRDTLQRHVFVTGGYEQALLREVTRRLRPSDVVLDVGANIGTFSLPVARRLSTAAGGRVLAVEPASDALRRLTRHIAINALEERAQPHRLALGDSSATATLRRGADPSKGDWGLRTLIGGGAAEEEVRVVPGDLFLREVGVAAVDVLKIDVEGFESRVLGGLRGQLAASPPRVVVMELVERHQRTAGQSTAELVGTMQRLGYRGYRIRIRGLEALDRQPAGGNALFLHDTEGSQR